MRRALVGFLAALVCLMAGNPLLAKEAALLAQDEATEKRLVAISSELRCLVCQNGRQRRQRRQQRRQRRQRRQQRGQRLYWDSLSMPSLL